MSSPYSVPGAFLVANLWWYGFMVLRPAQLLTPFRPYRTPDIGSPPARSNEPGAGRQYAIEYLEPVFLDERPAQYANVDAFDQLSSAYDRIIEPFSRPIFEEVTAVLRPLLWADARILDPSCGPGTEALELAGMVPAGEVVAMDLAAQMVSKTAASARARGYRNVAFFQADVANMPSHFSGSFDVVYCSLAFHHYPDASAALREMHRVLRRGGHAFVVDAGPWWMKALGSPLARLGDPGWIAFRTGDEFQELFFDAGFSRFYWTEVLPGIGLSVGTK